MIIGIDIDGTLKEYPEFFTTLGRLFRENGHSVYIITGLGWTRAIEKVEAIEKEWGGDFHDGVWSTVHYNELESQLVSVLPMDGGCGNEIVVGMFKQRICRMLKVDIMFDDKGDIHRGLDKHGVPIFTVPKNRFRE